MAKDLVKAYSLMDGGFEYVAEMDNARLYKKDKIIAKGCSAVSMGHLGWRVHSRSSQNVPLQSLSP
jgi:hypothetical protein